MRVSLCERKRARSLVGRAPAMNPSTDRDANLFRKFSALATAHATRASTGAAFPNAVAWWRTRVDTLHTLINNRST
jgi:hypothetical protein